MNAWLIAITRHRPCRSRTSSLHRLRPLPRMRDGLARPAARAVHGSGSRAPRISSRVAALWQERQSGRHRRDPRRSSLIASMGDIVVDLGGEGTAMDAERVLGEERGPGMLPLGSCSRAAVGRACAGRSPPDARPALLGKPPRRDAIALQKEHHRGAAWASFRSGDAGDRLAVDQRATDPLAGMEATIENLALVYGSRSTSSPTRSKIRYAGTSRRRRPPAPAGDPPPGLASSGISTTGRPSSVGGWPGAMLSTQTYGPSAADR